VKERIQKVLANYGVDSRRNIELMIGQGRIAVNGRVVTKLPVLIDPEEDKVTVDDELIKLARTRKGKSPVTKLYFLLNKPKGVYSTNVAQGEQRLAVDLLPADLPGRVYPVGRLDADSKGILLMTNDGDLTNLLTHPRYEVPKTYRVVVDGHVPDATVQKLREGIWLADKEGEGFKTGRSRILIVRRSGRETVLEVTIKEGRNRQVRRMLVRLGHKVQDLMRIKMGPLTLRGLGAGKFRPLTEREVKQLYGLAKAGEARAEGREGELEADEKSAGGKRGAASAAGPTKGGSKSPPTARPAAGRPRPVVEQADAGEDLAVEFEDDDLIREAAGGAAMGGGAGKAAGLKRKPAASDEADDSSGEDVEFVDLSPEEQAELDAEARALIAEDQDDEEPTDQGDEDDGDEDADEEADELPE
jgi:23S rRNA pseudouridine2605 synthase